jgi:hypothetical protein
MLQAQTENDLKLLNACKEEVSAINSLTLYKKQFFEGNIKVTENVTIVDLNEHEYAVLVYYDTEKRIRKRISIGRDSDIRTFSIWYFDAEGHLVYYINYAEGNEGNYKGYLYMNKGKLVYISMEVKDFITEQTKVVEQYGKMPDPDFFSFDNGFPLHTDKISKAELRFDMKTDRRVRFSTPQNGDLTVTNIRRANLRKSPSTDAERIAFVEMGNIVRIVERTNDQWYKISTDDGKTGYIFSEFLETVEREVK